MTRPATAPFERPLLDEPLEGAIVVTMVCVVTAPSLVMTVVMTVGVAFLLSLSLSLVVVFALVCTCVSKSMNHMCRMAQRLRQTTSQSSRVEQNVNSTSKDRKG